MRILTTTAGLGTIREEATADISYRWNLFDVEVKVRTMLLRFGAVAPRIGIDNAK